MAASLGRRHLEVLTSSSPFLSPSLSLSFSLEYRVQLAETPGAQAAKCHFHCTESLFIPGLIVGYILCSRPVRLIHLDPPYFKGKRFKNFFHCNFYAEQK